MDGRGSLHRAIVIQSPARAKPQLEWTMRDPVPLPALTDNYIWFLDLGERHVLVVDPGESEPVERMLDGGSVASMTILLTHHHLDHIAGAEALRERYRARVVAPEDQRIRVATDRAGDGTVIGLPGGVAARVIAVPGHTSTHVAYVVEDLLFCGDTLFSLGCGRLFEGTPAEMSNSLARLAALPAATRVCCGHEYTLANARFARTIEPDNDALAARIDWATRRRDLGLPTLPSTIEIERSANPFLRCTSPAVKAAVSDDGSGVDLEPVEVFARLRALKDRFGA